MPDQPMKTAVSLSQQSVIKSNLVNVQERLQKITYVQSKTSVTYLFSLTVDKDAVGDSRDSSKQRRRGPFTTADAIDFLL